MDSDEVSISVGATSWSRCVKSSAGALSHKCDKVKVELTWDEKYAAVLKMESIGQFTRGKYLTRKAFFRALAEARVFGDYTKRILVVSNEPKQEYTFVMHDERRVPTV